MISKRRNLTIVWALLISVGSVVLVAGCSNSGASATGANDAAGAATAKLGPPTADSIKASMNSTQSNPNLSAAQKQVVLQQEQAALSNATGKPQ